MCIERKSHPLQNGVYTDEYDEKAFKVPRVYDTVC